MEEVRRGGDLARIPSSSPSRDVRLSNELDESGLKLFGASCVSAKSNRITDWRGECCTGVHVVYTGSPCTVAFWMSLRVRTVLLQMPTILGMTLNIMFIKIHSLNFKIQMASKNTSAVCAQLIFRK